MRKGAQGTGSPVEIPEGRQVEFSDTKKSALLEHALTHSLHSSSTSFLLLHKKDRMIQCLSRCTEHSLLPFRLLHIQLHSTPLRQACGSGMMSLTQDLGEDLATKAAMCQQQRKLKMPLDIEQI